MINTNTIIFLPKKTPQLIPFSAVRARSIEKETSVAPKALYGGYFNRCIYKSAFDTS